MMVRVLTAALLIALSGAAFADEPWQAEWAKTVAAARKEGVVVVSGPPGPEQREAAIEAWQKAFPDIKIEYTGARGTQILSKVVRERQSGIYNWDVVIASTDPTVFMLPPIHALAPLKDALIDPSLTDDKNWVGGFDAGFVDGAGKYFYSVAGSAGMELGYVNRACVSEATLAKADDLMKPELKGKIAWYDPLVPGSSGRSTWRLDVDKGDQWLKTLFQQQRVAFSRDYRQMAEWVVTCEKPVGIGMPFDTIAMMKSEGLAKNVVVLAGSAYFGDHGLGWAGGNECIGLYANAPHPNAAKLFVNLYLSRDFQALWSKYNPTNSRRTDVQPGDPDPGAALDPKLHYVSWSNEESIRQVMALEAKIKSWGVVQ